MSQLRVLVVEDEPSIRTLVRRIVGRKDLLWEAKDGDEALALLQTQPMDVVLLDLILPGKKGDQLVGPIRQLSPAAKILVITGYPEQLLEHGLAVDGFLPKPFSPDELLQAMQRVLESKATD